MLQKSNLPKNLGNGLLFHAVTHCNIKDIITLLEDNEADINGRDINGATPLHAAVSCQNKISVEILLKFKADPNLQEYYDIGECTPLHRAVEKNNFEICQLLINSGANPSIQAKNGFTSLHYACRYGFKEITLLLISAGVDVNIRDKCGFNASYWAKTGKFVDILPLLPSEK